MAISETSKAASRTIGLKPLLVGEYSAKSSVTRSDLIAPFFSADVPGWSPSKVRKRIVISIGQGFIEIQRLAHIVHVEPERASGKLLALFVGPFDVADNDRLHAGSSKPVNPERETSYRIKPHGADADVALTWHSPAHGHATDRRASAARWPSSTPSRPPRKGCRSRQIRSRRSGCRPPAGRAADHRSPSCARPSPGRGNVRSSSASESPRSKSCKGFERSRPASGTPSRPARSAFAQTPAAWRTTSASRRSKAARP